MRHFKTKKQAQAFIDSKSIGIGTLRIFKKRKGMPNWKTKPFAVGTTLEWLNWW